MKGLNGFCNGEGGEVKRNTYGGISVEDVRINEETVSTSVYAVILVLRNSSLQHFRIK